MVLPASRRIDRVVEEDPNASKYVSRKVLDDTFNRYPMCKCGTARVGLLPGVYVEDLWMLGSGCTGSEFVHHTGWVCSRLDAVRRFYRPWDRK